MMTNDIERPATQIDKILKSTCWSTTTVDDVCHVRSQHERRAIPTKTSEHLGTTKKLGEIDVE
jgi:hypothetical protein